MKLDTLKTNAPIILYALFYFMFSLVGITLFYTQNELYLLFYERSSGIIRPMLSSIEQKETLFLIAYVVPMVFMVSFYVTYNKIKSNTVSSLLDKFLDVKEDICWIIYCFVLAVVMWRIFSVIDFRDIIYAYTNYDVMIGTRFILFDNLTRWDWMLIYSFLPAITGILYFKSKKIYMRYGVILMSSIILLYTMQKRYILLMVLFIYFIDFLSKKLEGKRIYIHSYYALMVACVFLVQTFLPTSYLFSASNFKTATMQRFHENTQQIGQSIHDQGKILTHSELVEINNKINEKLSASSQGNMHSLYTNFEIKGLYLLNAILNRTSIPMIYFFELFPYKKDYLGNWLGCFIPHYKDSTSEYEGNVVWKYTNGDSPGCLAAPFNFSLYAKVGILGTFIITLIYGVMLGTFWAIILSLSNQFAYAVLSSMMCIFMIFMALDNFTFSAFTSYGIFWWVLCLFMVCLISSLASLVYTWLREPIRTLT